MKIRLDKLGSEPFRWSEKVSVPLVGLDRPELVGLSEIQWRGQVWEKSPGFRLEALAKYEQTVSCDRCLTAIVQPVAAEVELMILQNAPESVEAELELTAEDLEITHVEGEEFDADRLLEEQIQLNVPMRAICREDCKGLCPVCGGNRNQDACDCETQQIDPRWEALRGLRGSKK